MYIYKKQYQLQLQHLCIWTERGLSWGSHSVVTLRIGACDCDDVDGATYLVCGWIFQPAMFDYQQVGMGQNPGT